MATTQTGIKGKIVQVLGAVVIKKIVDIKV